MSHSYMLLPFPATKSELLAPIKYPLQATILTSVAAKKDTTHKLLDKKSQHSVVKHVVSLQLNTGLPVVTTGNGTRLVPTQPIPSMMLGIGVFDVVDTTKLYASESTEAVKIMVLRWVDINSRGLGNERRPAWPPPELQIWHTPGIQHLQLASVHFVASLCPEPLMADNLCILVTCSVLKFLLIDSASSFLMAAHLKEANLRIPCSCELSFAETTICQNWGVLCFAGDEASKLQHLGTCHEKQYNGLTLQYSSCKKTMYGSESFPWYIAWLLVTSSCACTDYRGRTPMNMSTAANSEMEGGTRGAEALTFLRMFLYGRKFQLATLSAVVLYSNGGSNSLSAARAE